MATATVSVHIIPLELVSSSSLAGIGYDGDEERGTLAVQFQNGHVFHYASVPHRLWREFQMIPSKGQFYAGEIKGRYRGEKVTGACPSCGDVGYLGQVCTDCGVESYTQTQKQHERQ